MMSLNLTTTMLGIGLAAAILLLVRRDHLHLSHGVSWIAVAVVAAMLGAWPALLDTIATFAGISYPPALLLLAAVIVLLIKALLGDIANTRLERQIRRLNQRVALFEGGGDRGPVIDEKEVIRGGNRDSPARNPIA